MAKIKILKVDYHREGFIEYDYTRFEIEYEIKKWYWFGKSKINKTLVNIENWRADSWLKHIKNKIGVWENR